MGVVFSVVFWLVNNNSTYLLIVVFGRRSMSPAKQSHTIYYSIHRLSLGSRKLRVDETRQQGEIIRWFCQLPGVNVCMRACSRHPKRYRRRRITGYIIVTYAEHGGHKSGRQREGRARVKIGTE